MTGSRFSFSLESTLSGLSVAVSGRAESPVEGPAEGAAGVGSTEAWEERGDPGSLTLTSDARGRCERTRRSGSRVRGEFQPLPVPCPLTRAPCALLCAHTGAGTGQGLTANENYREAAPSKWH